LVQKWGTVEFISADTFYGAFAAFFGFGAYWSLVLIEAIRARDFWTTLPGFLVMGLPALAISIFGLRNVLRFPQSEGDVGGPH
jgi:hypothetical protein